MKPGYPAQVVTATRGGDWLGYALLLGDTAYLITQGARLGSVRVPITELTVVGKLDAPLPGLTGHAVLDSSGVTTYSVSLPAPGRQLLSVAVAVPAAESAALGAAHEAGYVAARLTLPPVPGGGFS